VLPTEDRFLNLTEEQLQLLYHHWELDIQAAKKPRNGNTNDPEYKDDEPEHYHDPDFDKEWDADEPDGELDSNIVGESPSVTPSESFGEVATSDGETPTNLDKREWEEV